MFPRLYHTQSLRDFFGRSSDFEGVITTDCMEMDAIAKRIGTVEGCVQAVEAGVDFVMVSHLHDLQVRRDPPVGGSGRKRPDFRATDR